MATVILESPKDNIIGASLGWTNSLVVTREKRGVEIYDATEAVSAHWTPTSGYKASHAAQPFKGEAVVTVHNGLYISVQNKSTEVQRTQMPGPVYSLSSSKLLGGNVVIVLEDGRLSLWGVESGENPVFSEAFGTVLHSQVLSLRGTIVLLSLIVNPKKPTSLLFEINTQKPPTEHKFHATAEYSIRPEEAKKGALLAAAVDAAAANIFTYWSSGHWSSYSLSTNQTYTEELAGGTKAAAVILRTNLAGLLVGGDSNTLHLVDLQYKTVRTLAQYSGKSGSVVGLIRGEQRLISVLQKGIYSADVSGVSSNLASVLGVSPAVPDDYLGQWNVTYDESGPQSVAESVDESAAALLTCAKGELGKALAAYTRVQPLSALPSAVLGVLLTRAAEAGAWALLPSACDGHRLSHAICPTLLPLAIDASELPTIEAILRSWVDIPETLLIRLVELACTLPAQILIKHFSAYKLLERAARFAFLTLIITAPFNPEFLKRQLVRLSPSSTLFLLDYLTCTLAVQTHPQVEGQLQLKPITTGQVVAWLNALVGGQFTKLALMSDAKPTIEALAQIAAEEKEQCEQLQFMRGILSHFLVEKPMPVPDQPRYFVQVLDL